MTYLYGKAYHNVTHFESITAQQEKGGDYAYSFLILNKKKLLSLTPLRLVLNNFIFELKDSAAAFDALLLQKYPCGYSSYNTK